MLTVFPTTTSPLTKVRKKTPPASDPAQKRLPLEAAKVHNGEGQTCTL